MRQSTKQAIAETLMGLLLTQSIDQITVKKIVETCGINRQTFYYHFCDIYDLLEWSLSHSIEAYLEEFPFPQGSWTEKARHLFHFFYTNRRRILHAYDANNRKLYEMFVMKMVRPIIEEQADSYPVTAAIPAEKREFVIKTFSWLYTAVFFEWLEEGMRDETTTHLNDFFTLAEGGLPDALEKFRPAAPSGRARR